MSTNKLFKISYIGKYVDTSIKELVNFFEYNSNSHNNNIFIFLAYVPAVLSIVKRFALYMLSIIFVLFFFIYSFGVNMIGYSLYSAIIVKFFLSVVVLLVFSLLCLYFMNAFFVYSSSSLNKSI